jgi:hypothetical protein
MLPGGKMSETAAVKKESSVTAAFMFEVGY